MVPLLLAVAVGLGVDNRRVALLATIAYLPALASVGVVLVLWRGRTHADARSALFCEAVASELRAGASLGQSVTAAATSLGNLSLDPSLSLTALADEVAAAFPDIGEELRLTVVTAGRTGSDTAALFDEIASLALAQSEIRREVKVATAPGRATAMILVGAPCAYILSQLGSGGIGDLLISPQQRVVALLGIGLFLLGLGAAATVAWRAGR